MSQEEQPLPYGWIKEFDRISNHPFWVDTKAVPPRSIWTHPYEDEQYLSEHPDVREKLGNRAPAPAQRARRHSFNGMATSDDMAGGSSRDPTKNAKSKSKSKPADAQKRGFFGKLKDKAIGTKEEREAERRRWAEMQELRRQQRQREQAYYAQQYQQQQYLYDQGGYYGGGGGGGGGYGPPMQYRQRGGGGFGGGGLGVPLLGGLLGGLLLGDILDGGFGGGFGGGFDGGGGGFF